MTIPEETAGSDVDRSARAGSARRRAQGRIVLVFAAATLLIVYISMAITWRLERAPDEASHLAVIDHYVSSTTLLDDDDMAYGGDRGHAYHHLSPVPYLVYVPFAWADDQIGPIEGSSRPRSTLIRFGGIPIAVAQLAVTFLIARRLVPSMTALPAIAVATAVNLLPQLRYTHAYANPDGLAILAGSLAFLAALRIVRVERVGLADALAAGAAMSILLLSRLNTLPVALVLVAAVVYRLVRQPGPRRARLRLGALAALVPMWVAGPFHLYVYARLDNGDLLPTDTVMAMGDSTFAGRIAPTPPFGDLVDARIANLPHFWGSTWLWFVDHVALTGLPLGLLAAGCLTGIVGLLTPRSPLLDRPARVMGLAVVVCFLATYLTIASEWLYGQQGRFLLPAGVAALVGIIVGTGALIGRLPRTGDGIYAASALWGIPLLAANIWAIIVIF